MVADHQTAGRGRLGRSWLSEPGRNLLFSIVLRPTLPKETSSFLTFFSAVFIARALEKITGHDVECKWPNDVLVNGKKCCGILLENSFARESLEFSVVGIGINVNQSVFGPELEGRATSLATEYGVTYDRTSLLQALLREADSLLPSIAKGYSGTIMEEWNKRCTLFGKSITVMHGDEAISGTAVSLNGDGGLIIQTPDGRKTVYAGDVTVISDK